MTRAFLSRLRQGFRNEDGSAAVEFVIIFPVIATLIVMTLEMGFITLRQTMLERGLDMAVREVRLGTTAPPSHDEIKDLICDNALILSNCAENLYLEMVPGDVRGFTGLHTLASCTDEDMGDTRPVRTFTPGQQNQLVMLRACVLYDPLFPEGMLPRVLASDGLGKSAIIAVTAFVQEPA